MFCSATGDFERTLAHLLFTVPKTSILAYFVTRAEASRRDGHVTDFEWLD